MNEHDEQSIAEDTHAVADQVDGVDHVADLVARARTACADHPELLEQLELIDRLDEVELSRRPEVLDAAHRTLREVLAGAGRSGPRP